MLFLFVLIGIVSDRDRVCKYQRIFICANSNSPIETVFLNWQSYLWIVLHKSYVNLNFFPSTHAVMEFSAHFAVRILVENRTWIETFTSIVFGTLFVTEAGDIGLYKHALYCTI